MIRKYNLTFKNTHPPFALFHPDCALFDCSNLWILRYAPSKRVITLWLFTNIVYLYPAK